MTPDPSPITRRFLDRRRRGESALVPYVCAGFPDADATVEVMEAAADAGADVLELGIPFSDPLADGPTIQRASFRALERGMTAAGALALVERFRSRRDVPVVVFTYLNPLLRYGVERFLADARSAGAEGLLLTDLPVGGDPELEERLAGGELDPIRLLSPTTPPERRAEVARSARGFLYYISRTGVTGARADLRAELAEEVGAIRRVTDLPVAVGFGISSPEQAARVADLADGVVVGSALVQAVEEEGPAGAARFLAALREAMDRGGAERPAGPVAPGG